MKTACPKCGFTKEPLRSGCKDTVELVLNGESGFGLLFNCYLLDGLLPVHYCHKCGFHLDGQKEAGCALCAGREMQCSDPFVYVEKSSLDILEAPFSRASFFRKKTHYTRHTTLLIGHALEDEHGPGSHAEANYCPACGRKW